MYQIDFDVISKAEWFSNDGTYRIVTSYVIRTANQYEK